MATKFIKPQFKRFKQKIFEQIIQTGQFIHHIGELKDLRKPSREVQLSKIKTLEVQQKIKYLKSCLRKYRKLTGIGRGIAGVQVGIPEKIILVWMPEIKGSILTVINPKIIHSSKTLLKYPEVCMSATPLVAPVVRPSWIEFEYFDDFGNKKRWDTKDSDKKGKMYNRIFEHEIDHLDGIINIDRVSSSELVFELNPKQYGKSSFQEIKAAK